MALQTKRRRICTKQQFRTSSQRPSQSPLRQLCTHWDNKQLL